MAAGLVGGIGFPGNAWGWAGGQVLWVRSGSDG